VEVRVDKIQVEELAVQVVEVLWVMAVDLELLDKEIMVDQEQEEMVVVAEEVVLVLLEEMVEMAEH
jgi:hypothetical protein